MASPRIACVQVPQLPLAARLRSEPGLREQPLAIIENGGGAARVVAASRRAREAGVRAKRTLAAARACSPKLIVRLRDPECESAAHEALLDLAESFSPRVEDGGDGVVYLDAGALSRHSGPSSELRLGRAWMVAAEQQAGLSIRIGFAAGRLAARLATTNPDSPTIIAAGDEAGFLAPVPWSRAVPRSDYARPLRRWGIQTLGELAALPESELWDRLGTVGEELRAIALGRDSRPLKPRRPPPAFREGMMLAEPLIDLEPLSVLVRGAMERLVERLKALSLGCVCLELSLDLDTDRSFRRSIALPTPTRDVRTLLTLLRLELESHPPRAAIAGFAVTAHPDCPRGGQISLFGPPAVLPDELAAALKQLFATVGEDRVGSPCTADGCRPERFKLAPYAPPKPAENGAAERRPGLMTVRVLRPPVELEVMTDDARTGAASAPPDFIKSRAEAWEKRPRIQGRVRVASGPWTLADGWWAKAPTARDYWDVELFQSGVYRIFRDRGKDHWYADGVYD